MRTSFTALMVVMMLLAQQAEAGVTFVVGDVDGPGWTNKANVDYNKLLSSYNIKVGDTLEFPNLDSTDHTAVFVDKASYDTCGESGEKYSTFTISPLQSYMATFKAAGDFYFICDIPRHCIQGMKVYIQVLNADGSVSTTPSSDAPNKSSAAPPPTPHGLISWARSHLVIVLVSTFYLMAAAAASM